MTGKNSEVLVIGAGIVGVSTALWLQRAGLNVTLTDRSGPASGTSHGNGGILAACAVVPVTVPGLLARAPRMLLDPDQPLFLKWRYLPRLLPFLRRYLANATDAQVERTSRALTDLLGDCADQHIALAQGTPAAAYVRPGSYLFGYPDKAAFDADGYVWSIRRKRGYRFREMTADDMAAHDPALAGRFGYGVECPDHGLITDPGAYVKALAEHFVANGGTLLTDEITGFDLSGDIVTGARTRAGAIAADSFVLATGVWSGSLARQLGITVPLESERGYHVEFVNPSITLKSPIMVAAGKFVVGSMEGRLRCAGVVEFGGLDTGPSRAPFDLLKRQVAALFPDLTYDNIVEWMGHRPATADSIPAIGQAPAARNVYVGYGHHHIGLSGGPKTGRWLAQMITGQPVNTDLSAFSPARQA
ncbi:NAD(P)/FAD-dependent oxidoreductase [Sedimentitalea sp. XS_ASV28]|uniref:NAD(P)/FAD-dependent oxidoreductase n=1 Tax=Sedimentitalea sp. XS_ASV28 TaxID=3241296 RepID=UPI00351543B8